jgi:hypothetical protein
MHVSDILAFDETTGIFKIFIRFSGESDDHICGNTGVRHEFPDPANPVGEYFPFVFAFHALKRPVVASLQGDVEVGEETL